MKVVKPLKLGTLFRAFEYRGRYFWSPAVMAFFSFDDPVRLLSEIDMWQFIPEQLGKDAILDMGMPKARGELLVSGRFFSPTGQPVPAGKVRIAMGPVDKQLYVFGDRFWIQTAALSWTISEPVPAADIAIDYAHAFGGPDFKFNPTGKGTAPIEMADQIQLVPLPNVEDPDRLVAARSDRPPPAGFGPLDMAWPQRMAKSGTYDDKWYETRFPGLADDLDWSFYNTAPEDQQISGFWQGSETFTIDWMHPDQAHLSGRLPHIRPRCFINRREKDNLLFEALDLNLDTVWLFPHAKRGVLVYRGLTEVFTDTAKDIEHLLVAYESADQAPREMAHYHAALDKRLDKDKGFLTLLDERDLMPEGETTGFAEMMDSEAVSQARGDGLLEAKQRRRMEMDLAQVRGMLADKGLDPDQVLPLPKATPADGANVDFSQAMDEFEQHRKEAERVLEQQLATLGMTKAQMNEAATSEPAPRPVFSAEQAIESYQALGIGGPDIEEKLKTAEKQFLNTYRQFGHHLPPVAAHGPDAARRKREQLLAAYDSGQSCRGLDLAGVDLAGLDMKGIDLRDAFLENANLAGACLAGARMDNCALMRADLTAADLSSTRLTGAGLGRAVLKQARLNGADLTDASLVMADLAGAVAESTTFKRADLSETAMTRVQMAGANMAKTRLVDSDMTHARLCKTDFSDSLMFNTILVGADLTQANLSKAILIKVKATGALFHHAEIRNLRAATDCCFEDAEFDNARLIGTNLRGARLAGARFVNADLSQSDLSEADLTGCNFFRAVARQTLFIEANLTRAKMISANLSESLIQKAVLEETDFKGANLYAVDFMKSSFHNTDARQALVLKSTLGRWVPR